MSFDLIAEKAGFEALLAGLAGGRIWAERIPDETEIERYPGTNDIKPYIVVSFGTLYPSARNRTIMGEEQQPQIWPGYIECWAKDADSKNRLAGACRKAILGKHINENCDEIRFRGGGSYSNGSQSIKPTRYVEVINWETIVNMSVEV